jgi:hypothetical protein
VTLPSASPDPLDLLALHRRWSAQLDDPPGRDDLYGVRVVHAASSGACRVLPGSTLPDTVLTDVEGILRDVRRGPIPTDALVAVVRRAVTDGGVPRLDGGPVTSSERSRQRARP